jgi:hypothetical protein
MLSRPVYLNNCKPLPNRLGAVSHHLKPKRHASSGTRQAESAESDTKYPSCLPRQLTQATPQCLTPTRYLEPDALLPSLVALEVVPECGRRRAMSGASLALTTPGSAAVTAAEKMEQGLGPGAKVVFGSSPERPVNRWSDDHAAMSLGRLVLRSSVVAGGGSIPSSARNSLS